MSSLLFGTDRISLREKSLRPHERPFKLQKWAFGAFKLDLELEGLGL